VAFAEVIVAAAVELPPQQRKEGRAVVAMNTAPLDNPTEKVPCPFCKSEQTQCIALFGPKLLTSQYFCHACHTAFEVVRQ
jgi:transposase-like protein